VSPNDLKWDMVEAGSPPNELRRQLARLAALVATAFAAFLVTTPGAVLEPFAFIRDGRNIASIYARGHGGFTTTSALQRVGDGPA
jgi:hypothetical protein